MPSGPKRKSVFMRLIKEALWLVLFALVLGALFDHFRAPRLPKETMPPLPSGRLVDGSFWDSSRGTGPLLLHFWGTWCPVCRMEADNIQRVSRHYRVLSVAVGSGTDDEIRRWMHDRGVAYAVLNDSRGIWARRYGVRVYPTSFIFDSAGKLKFVLSGYSTTPGLLARMKLAE